MAGFSTILCKRLIGTSAGQIILRRWTSSKDQCHCYMYAISNTKLHITTQH